MFEKSKLKKKLFFMMCFLLIGTISNPIFVNGLRNSDVESIEPLASLSDSSSESEKFIDEIQASFNDTTNLPKLDEQSFFPQNELDSTIAYSRNIFRNSYMNRYHPKSLIKVREDEKIEFILKYNDEFDLLENEELFTKHGVEVARRCDTDNLFILYVPKDSVEGSHLNFIIEAQSVLGIEFVEPNFYYSKAEFYPNDPYDYRQWAPAREFMDLYNAWDVQLGSLSVVVAIIDTGIDYTHSDLVGQYLPLGYDFVNSDNDPFDDSGHGTQCAGTLAATINNGIGIAGVAGVSIFAEKGLDEFGNGTAENLASCIDHAVTQGADIISLSWGGYGYSQLLNDSVQNAIDAGVLIVAASGDDGLTDPFYPAALPRVFAVGAIDWNHNLAPFSNYGDWIDVCAPGMEIYTTLPGNSYGYVSGTSLACPLVAGLAALILSEFPSYTWDFLSTVMEVTAIDLGDPGYDIYFGWGMVHAATAIYGKEVHNMQATLICPDAIPYDLTTTIELKVSNIGLSEETDIHARIEIYEYVVSTTVIPSLAPGEDYYYEYNISTPGMGLLNITGYIEPVPGETVIIDNQATKFVESRDKLYGIQIGDTLAYGETSSFYPFEIKWDVVDILSPSEYIINCTYFIPDTLSEYLYGTYILNPYTREISDLWGLFPYWLHPDNLFLGAIVDIFYVGGNDGEVIGETTFNYYGEIVDVWILDDPDDEWQMYEKYYYVKDTGVLIASTDSSYNIYWGGTYISELSPSDTIHNLRQVVDFFERNNLNFTIPVLIHNTGHFNEIFIVEILIDGELLTSTTFNFDSGEYYFWEVEWRPVSHSIYLVEVNTTIVTGETYSIDNFYSIDFSTYPPVQYTMSSTSFIWYDTYNSGQSLGLIGDDVFKSVNLQFDFFFYDYFFSTIYIDSNGLLSFVELDSLTFYVDAFPSEWYNYVIAPFWFDLVAGNNVHYLSTSDFFAVTYWYYSTATGNPIGTFEVVLHSNGEIVFQYHSIQYDPGSAVGLSYGRDLSYYTLYTPSLQGANNFAILFSPLPDTGYIEVNVYEDSLVPKPNVQVEIYIDATNILIASGLTNADGFYKAVALTSDFYRIEVVANGYVPESQFEFVDFYEGYSLYFHLELIPIRNIIIYSPTEGQTIDGGLVFINLQTDNENDVVLVDMFVNDIWIANVTALYSEYICVPIFENGTNVIRLEFLWADTGTESAEITINSINVSPIFDIDDGDYFNLKMDFPDGEMYIEQKMKFFWYSEFELNITSIMRIYDYTNTTIDQLEYFAIVNILNGYTTDSDVPGFIHGHFSIFNRVTQETFIGDPFISTFWSDIVYIEGSLFWRGNDVWTITMTGGVLIYVHKDSGFLIYEYVPVSSFGEGFGFVKTNIFNLVYTPVLASLEDYTYDYGTTGHTLTWVAYDEETSHYEIYKDGDMIETDAWFSDIPIVINIDSLEVGTYNYTILVVDEEGSSATDTVIVTVIPVILEYKNLQYILILPLMICIIYTRILKKRKNLFKT